MIRTQIQLENELADQLKRLAAAEGRSMADVARQAIDGWINRRGGGGHADKMRRATRAFGRFRSGHHDLADKHDEHFVNASSRDER